MKASDLRPGMAVTIDKKLYVCVQASHVTPGNLRAFVQTKLKCVADGIIIERRLRSTEDVELAYLDRREIEYLYSDHTGHILMDTKTFEQFTVSDDIIGGVIKYFKPNTNVIALLNEGNVVSIELPRAVELMVTETNPVPKGATVTSQLKDAVLETGLKARVPPFIVVGNVVKINTDDGSYIGRVK